MFPLLLSLRPVPPQVTRRSGPEQQPIAPQRLTRERGRYSVQEVRQGRLADVLAEIGP